MDSDRQLKSDFRRALDEVLPPAPWLEAVVTDDLRRRAHRSVDGRHDTSKQTSVLWPRSAMQLAAGALVVVLAAAAVVTFLVRYHAPQSEPGGLASANAYQVMVKRGDGELIVARNDNCLTLQSTCPASGTPVLFALQRWLDDLNRSEPPARFAVIDAQLRRHISANISEVNALIAAYQIQDQNGLDRAHYASGHQQGWLDDVTRSIGDSQPASAAAYVASVRAAYQTFGCAACQSLANQVDCTEMQAMSCEYDVFNVMATIGPFEAALVRVGAPSSLAAQDTRLQNDLAQADSSVLAIANAQLTGDQAGFNAGWLSLQQALLAINADIVGVLNR